MFDVEVVTREVQAAFAPFRSKGGSAVKELIEERRAEELKEVAAAESTILIHPLTPERWGDLADLFGPERGANSGCWCMWTRLPGKDWKAMAREERRDAFRRVVEKGPPPGLLAYDGGVPVGWVAVGPRPSVQRFNTAKNSRPVEDARSPDPERTYAVSCFYTRPGQRKRGLMARLAKEAVAFAKKSGAEAVEVCAIEPDKPLQWGEAFVGVASVFQPLGFREVARRSPKRPLLRLALKSPNHPPPIPGDERCH